MRAMCLKFQLTDGEDHRKISTLWSRFSFEAWCFHRNSDSYFPSGIHFLAWDHLYLTLCSSCSSPWVPCHCPLDFLSVKCMEPQHSILDFWIWLTLQGFKQDLNAHKDFEKLFGGRNSHGNPQSNYSTNVYHFQKFGVPHITTSQPPLLKTKNSNKTKA